jgi:hypothetical protein
MLLEIRLAFAGKDAGAPARGDSTFNNVRLHRGVRFSLRHGDFVVMCGDFGFSTDAQFDDIANRLVTSRLICD